MCCLPIADQYVDAELSPDSFSELVQNYVDAGQETTEHSERLEMIRSAVDEMDESEVTGFLAMLENQSGWTPRENSSEAGSFSLLNRLGSVNESYSSPQQPVQTQQPALHVASPENTMSLAVQEALTKSS